MQEQVQLDLKRFAAVIRDAVRRAAGHGQSLRRLRGADGKQAIDRQRIKRFDMRAIGDELAENGIAQILDEKEPRAQIAREDGGRADPGFAAQPFGNREERAAFAREMRDFAIGPAVANWRAVGPRRPVHQHDGLAQARCSVLPRSKLAPLILSFSPWERGRCGTLRAQFRRPFSHGERDRVRGDSLS